ncbi:MAG: hypothetical protein K1X53_16115 [Candidatus Sumerlaeaceae bacterium]|nr:hypothetical protein [Candidatus Sumerlaeaceae bacterium]
MKVLDLDRSKAITRIAQAIALVAVALVAFCFPSVCLAQFASPADWRDETIYQIITDRWDDGNSANNSTHATYGPVNGQQSHGGDFAGLKKRLYYLRGLGVTAVWIAPFVYNVDGTYHGYAAQDFTQVDPHWGTLADLQQFIQICHGLGIRVVLDVVCNHGANLFNDNSYRSTTPFYTLTYRNSGKTHAAPFNSTAYFHNQGSIGNYSDPEQILGELAGLDDLRTEDSYVRIQMASIWSNWITTLDADAFRIDTVKHVEIGFWQTWTPMVRTNAAAFGKTNFLFFGEIFDGNDAKNGYYTGTKAGGAFALDSTLDYPLYYATNSVFATASAGAQNIVNHYNAIPGNYDAAAQDKLVTFLDNHDNPRFLSSGLASDNTARLRAALVFQLTSKGIPCIYYGTEQHFNGGGDPNCREDMFDGQFEFGPSLGNNFDQTGTTYRLVRKLNQMRRQYAALTRGAMTIREVSSSAGMFAYSRIYGGTEVLVAVNTSGSAKSSQSWATGLTPGIVLVDALGSGSQITVGAGGTIASGIAFAANQARVYVPLSSFQDFDPEVTACNIGLGATVSVASVPLTLTFSKAMDTAASNAAFVTTPTIAGSLSWDGSATQLSFTPTGGSWPDSVTVLAGLDESAKDQQGNSLRGGFQTEFRTVPVPVSGIDGQISGDSRWAAAAATQTVQTGFGDNSITAPDQNSGGSEADQLFVAQSTSTLYLAVGGALEINGNSIILFFDTDGGATGANILTASGATLPWLASTPNSASGTRLPTGMKANLALQVQLATPNQSLNLFAYKWNAAGQFLSENQVGSLAGSSGNPTYGTISGLVNGQTYSFPIGYRNGHTGPVTAGSGTASPNGAGAGTGLEIGIPKSLLGVGPVSVLVGVSGSTGYWSNQFLPPLSPAASNRAWAPNLATSGVTAYNIGLLPIGLTEFLVE